jgi:hypothetical protein
MTSHIPAPTPTPTPTQVLFFSFSSFLPSLPNLHSPFLCAPSNPAANILPTGPVPSPPPPGTPPVPDVCCYCRSPIPPPPHPFDLRSGEGSVCAWPITDGALSVLTCDDGTTGTLLPAIWELRLFQRYLVLCYVGPLWR